MAHGLGRELGKLFRIDTDREHRRARLAILRGDDAVVNGEIQLALNVGQKILAVFLGLEADQIIGQHRLDQVAMMRYTADHRAGGPGCVQEEADRSGDAEISQFRAKCQKMIILNPERGVGLLEAEQRARHEGVHFAIGQVIVVAGLDQVGAGMQRRPQRRIREAFVIAAIVGGRQIQHRQRTGPQCFNFGEWFLLVPVTDPAAGADPDRPGFLDNRQ